MAQVTADEIEQENFKPIRLEIILETRKEAEALGKLANYIPIHDYWNNTYGYDSTILLTRVYQALQSRGINIQNNGSKKLYFGGTK